MSERHFQLRLQALYAQPDNSVAGLAVQKPGVEGWEEFVLNPLTPGFEIFVYSVLSCQHTYFRLNCAERGLLLGEARGEIEMVTDEDWALNSLQVSLQGDLLQGQPTDETIDYIVGRMKQCPVSQNIRDIPNTETRISFDR